MAVWIYSTLYPSEASTDIKFLKNEIIESRNIFEGEYSWEIYIGEESSVSPP